jgi:hypothetical protein
LCISQFATGSFAERPELTRADASELSTVYRAETGLSIDGEQAEYCSSKVADALAGPLMVNAMCV